MKEAKKAVNRAKTMMAALWALSAFAAVGNSEAVSVSAVEWQEPVIVATGPAHAGLWRMNESELHYVVDASVALREDGEAAVVWVDNERRDVFLQRYSPRSQARFDSPVNVSGTPEVFSWLPRVKFSSEGHIYVVWQEIVFSGGSHGGEIFFARSTNGGLSFEAPVNVSNTVHGAGKGRLTEEVWDNGSFDVAISSQGTIAIAWTEYQGALRVCRSTDGGRSFSRPVQLRGSSEMPARGPSLDFGEGDELYLAWTVVQGSEGDIHVARSSNGGQSFGPESVVGNAAAFADTPSLAVNQEGMLHLVYAGSDEGFFGASNLWYLQLEEVGAELGSPVRLLADEGDEQLSRSAPALALGAKDYVFALWERRPRPGAARGLGFALSADGGDRFSQPVVVPGSIDPEGGINGSLQGELGRKLAANGSGGVAVTNSHFLEGERSRIVLIRGQVED